jgi:outer membrane biosynthesis protein TonB
VRHLTVQQISASLDGALSGVSLELVVRHLSSCHECRERHSRLTKQDDALRRLLACDFAEVFFDDMFVRLTVVLEAESRGQMPPEHSRPPELPPLSPERPASRQMPRPKSAEMRNPALPSEEEQQRRVTEELKAAETAALNSLEQLMRDMQEGRKAVSAPSADSAGTPPSPPSASAGAARAHPPSLIALPADVLASLRQVGSPRPAPAVPEPVAEPPVAEPPVAEPPAPEPVHAEPEPEPVGEASEESGQGVFEESTLTWVVVDGPLPEGPDLEGEREDVTPVESEPAADPEPIHVPAPEPVQAAEPEPEPEPVHAAEPEPEPEPVHAAEPEPIHVPEPEPVRAAEPEPIHVPEPVRAAEPEPVRAAKPEPVRVPALESLRAPEPRPVRAAAPVPAPPKRRVGPTPNPVDDPYADYEERLVSAPPRHSRYIPPRRPRKRHIGLAIAGVVVLAMALGSLGYLPTVIRVPVPELPRPHIPRIEVVKVPLSPSGKSSGRGPGARTVSTQPSDEHGQTRTANQNDTGPEVVHTPKTPPAEAPPEEPAHVTVVEPAPPAKPEPAPVTAAIVPAHVPAPPVETARPSRVEPARTTTVPAHREPARTAPAPKPVASKPAEPAFDEGASWPLLCGVVLDDTGSPVAGARVALADLDLSARTDRRGRFCVAAPPGDRTLSVVAQGFATHRRIVSLGAAGLDISITLPATP